MLFCSDQIKHFSSLKRFPPYHGDLTKKVYCVQDLFWPRKLTGIYIMLYFKYLQHFLIKLS